ncbi:MAG: response regulator [Thermodesulfobacteriota bacterium]
MAKKILVVDDEPDIREILREFFQEYGYEVTTAGNGDEALEILGRESIPVMFLDLNLPGMNGLELCRRIRPQHPKARIYALTGYHRQFTPTSAREAGFTNYFTKPVDLRVLRRAANGAVEAVNGANPAGGGPGPSPR